ncbi:MAG: hydrolase [Saprospiraceae bacterium]|nr:MAG: hydrolase [Saprospiraceae bacterium]
MNEILKNNNVTIKGKGDQAILFAHGYGCDSNMWRFVAPAFYDEYQVILFDHIGAGKSDTSRYDREKYALLDGYAADVIEICKALDLKEVIFVGHSVSAMIGALAVNQAPAYFSKLVLLGPSPRYINDGPYIGGFNQEDIEGLLESLESNYLGWSSTMAPMIMGNADRPELGKELANSFCKMDPEIAKHFARTTFLSDNRADLPKVKIPTLILQCSEDIIASEVVGKYVNEQIPYSSIIFMKATGHCPNLSAPEETIAEIKKFL